MRNLTFGYFESGRPRRCSYSPAAGKRKSQTDRPAVRTSSPGHFAPLGGHSLAKMEEECGNKPQSSLAHCIDNIESNYTIARGCCGFFHSSGRELGASGRTCCSSSSRSIWRLTLASTAWTRSPPPSRRRWTHRGSERARACWCPAKFTRAHTWDK